MALFTFFKSLFKDSAVDKEIEALQLEVKKLQTKLELLEITSQNLHTSITALGNSYIIADKQIENMATAVEMILTHMDTDHYGMSFGENKKDDFLN